MFLLDDGSVLLNEPPGIYSVTAVATLAGASPHGLTFSRCFHVEADRKTINFEVEIVVQPDSTPAFLVEVRRFFGFEATWSHELASSKFLQGLHPDRTILVTTPWTLSFFTIFGFVSSLSSAHT